MKKFLAVILAAGMALSLMACGGQSTQPAAESAATEEAAAETPADGAVQPVNAGYITMGTNAYFPPYEYYEGDQIVGIDVEIAQKVADKLGLELKIEDMEFDSVITAVQTGKVDFGMSGITITEDRKKNVDFTDSYTTAVQLVIVKEDSDIASIDDLTGKKIGVQLATTGDIYCSGDYGEENVEKYNKGSDAVMALLSGKVDAVVIDSEVAKSFVKANEGLKILDTEYALEYYAAAIAKGNTALLEAWNETIQEMQEDGSLQAIIDKYISAE